MPVTLIIEDGSGVTDANAYGVSDTPTTLAAARQYALNRGVTLSVDDDVLSSQLILATDFLESFSGQFVGRKGSTAQALSWPRKGVMLDRCTYFPSDELPQALLNVEYQLCIEQFNGIPLQPTTYRQGKGFVTRETIDVITTEYSDRIIPTNEPLMPAVMALLSTLLWSSSGTGLKTIRV